MPRRNADGRKPQLPKAASTHVRTPSRRAHTYAGLRAQAERYYADQAFREAMPWSELPA
jgi:hypothetical protein